MSSMNVEGAAVAVLRRLATRDDGDTVNCGSGGGDDSMEGLRIASIFIVGVGSMFGATFPVVAYRSRLRNIIPNAVFDFAKYFGSGVIIATAFIHLLDPAIDELSSPCLTGNWQVYPWALALCMLSIFSIFFVELFAFRWGTARLSKLGSDYDQHGHGFPGQHASHGPEPEIQVKREADAKSSSSDLERGAAQVTTHNHDHHEHRILSTDNALAQVIGVFILEFGVLLHSLLIGLTLAVSDEFKVLFVVIVFHQMFEGLGLGSRLAHLQMPVKYNYVAYCAAILYGVTTPLGIAIGLGVRTTYNPDSATASIVSGILDSLSAGVLIYTGLVELLAHEFLFSKEMREADTKHLSYACGCMLLGAGLMALLGRWA